jgi:hypothetical protein
MDFIKARNKRIDNYANQTDDRIECQPLTAPTQKLRLSG